MFSYRHSFHAGNHADVFKHICQMLIIEKLKSKDKGFVYIDTHSGAGKYDLNDETSQKTAEFNTGVKRLQGYTGSNTTILNYLTLIKNDLADDLYPGSPEIARRMMRQQDKLHLMEWHNQEVLNLKRNMRGANLAVHHRDGYEGLIALTPPTPPRGLVLIDPSYEVPNEYQKLEASLLQASKRWPTGIYAIWYPLLSARAGGKSGQSQLMIERLARREGFKNLLVAELHVDDPTDDTGMYGSGMAIFNAPWQLDTQIQDATPELVSALGRSDAAKCTIEWLLRD